MRQVLIVLALVFICVVLGLTWMFLQPLLARTQAWPAIESALTPIPYILASAAGLLFIYAGLFATPATLRKFSGSLSLLPPSISTPLSRVGFVLTGLLVLSVVGYILYIHSVG
jgi:hypothetical protein